MYDSEYKRLVELEFNKIVDICQSNNDFIPVTGEEVMKAIKSLNTGKSGDIFDIQAEHFIHCAELISPVLANLFNTMFRIGQGVHQGGIMSTDLYKVYENPLLDRLQGFTGRNILRLILINH